MRTNEVASAFKLAVALFGLIETPAVVGVGHPLAQRRIVVHSPNSLDQSVVELSGRDSHATFLGPPDVLASFLRQCFPPLVEFNQMDCGDALPLEGIRILWERRGELLGEGKDVGLQST